MALAQLLRVSSQRGLARRISPLNHVLYKKQSSLAAEPGQSVGPSNKWEVVRAKDIAEFNLKAIQLVHKECGAKYLHLQAPHDPINAFSANFATVPSDSSGISHVLEHCVLCGSDKFPVRDPFFKMLSR